MKKICPTCGKIVDMHHTCNKKRKYKYDTRSSDIHHSSEWTKKSIQIRARDGGIDQAAINGLDVEHPKPYICQGTEVHHIIPLKERPDLAFDDDNLITLSSHTHKLAEDGIISKAALKRLAEANNIRYNG